MGNLERPQVVNLAHDCMYLATVIHELMHAIGFIHEQSRPDRDKYIQVYLKNVKNPSRLLLIFR